VHAMDLLIDLAAEVEVSTTRVKGAGRKRKQKFASDINTTSFKFVRCSFSLFLREGINTSRLTTKTNFN
jgi:hypothetical protein